MSSNPESILLKFNKLRETAQQAIDAIPDSFPQGDFKSSDRRISLRVDSDSVAVAVSESLIEDAELRADVEDAIRSIFEQFLPDLNPMPEFSRETGAQADALLAGTREALATQAERTDAYFAEMKQRMDVLRRRADL